jgi:hypothetical protein
MTSRRLSCVPYTLSADLPRRDAPQYATLVDLGSQRRSLSRECVTWNLTPGEARQTENRQ